MKIIMQFLAGMCFVAISACGGGDDDGGSDSETNNDISQVAKVTIVGVPTCDDFGGAGDFGCRIVPSGAPPDIGLTISDTTESILV